MFNNSRQYYIEAVKAQSPKKPPRKKKMNELFEISTKVANKSKQSLNKSKQSFNYSTKGGKKKK